MSASATENQPVRLVSGITSTVTSGSASSPATPRLFLVAQAKIGKPGAVRGI